MNTHSNTQALGSKSRRPIVTKAMVEWMRSKDQVVKARKLRPWDAFTSAFTSALTSDERHYMDQFDPRMREHILVALYGRAEMREDLENLRTHERNRSGTLRKMRRQALEFRNRLRKFLQYLDDPGNTFLRNLPGGDDLRRARRRLGQEEKKLQILQTLLAFSIHPALRNANERAIAGKSELLQSWKRLPGFGTATVDQRFIGWMDSYLRLLVRSNGRPLPSAEIDRIIVDTLKAAFGYHCAEDRVKVTRRRLKAGSIKLSQK